MNELHKEILQAIQDRTSWEEEQKLWFLMRRDGLRRTNRSSWQADLHYPLIDSVIEKLKPFYYNQFASGMRIPQFTPLRRNMEAFAESCADVFDRELKQRTNFETTVLSAIDFMLERGRGIVKVRHDIKGKDLVFESIDPVYIIMPAAASDFQTADWFTHVKRVTKKQYQMTPQYNQDPDLVYRLCGGRDDLPAQLQTEKEMREGITHSPKPNEIIIWEVFVRDSDGWAVVTYSPTAPDALIRQSFRLSYNYRGKAFAPFVSLVADIGEDGWYAPRGVAAKLDHFESYLCKTWNAKADFLAFISKPLFSGESPTNQTNYRLQPGDFLPRETQMLQMPQLPPGIQEELMHTRAVAEQSIMVPDFGVNGMDGKNDSRTATEVDYIRAISSFGVDLKGKVFRQGISQLLQYSWAILVKEKLAAVTQDISDDADILPQEALAQQYLIEPSGSPEQWNKQAQVQRALARYQTLQGNPFVDPMELAKQLVAADDARLVRNLIKDPGLKKASEQEDEAKEVLLLMSGFPAVVEPGEDHQARIQVLAGKLQQLGENGVPVDPVAARLIQEHMAVHVQYLRQQNPRTAKALEAAMIQADQSAAMIPQQPQPDVGATAPPMEEVPA